jgi:hypothetical protein
MLETSAYFEAYRHVLNALSQLYDRESEFPFKKHIVDCVNESMSPPDYLFNGYIDFTPLLKKKKMKFVQRKGQTNKTTVVATDDDSAGLSLEFAKACYIANESQWPSPSQFKFDDSQYDAIKLALNKRIALIQG